MRHYVFNVSDGDRQKGRALLRAKMWGVGRDERCRDALAPGDLALIYLAAPAAEFIGRVELATAAHDWTPAEAADFPGEAPGGVLLARVEEWDPAVPMDAVVRRIDPSGSNPLVQANAAAGFSTGLVRITADEYESALALSSQAQGRSQLPGGCSMGDRKPWKAARLEDIEPRGRDLPVREHLGIQAFGVNAFTPGEDGTVVGEHDEAASGQEELYVVLDGTATFEIDGETVDAPAGTLVFVGPESKRKATGDATVLIIGAAHGEAYQGVDWGEAWPYHTESMKAYGEQRYGDALEAVRGALELMPDHAGLNYNYACFATLAGETGDDTFAHLRRSVELLPRFREDARRDDDFAAIRDDPRFEEALR